MASRFACRLGLLAFAATLAEGVVSGSDVVSGLTTALIRLALFYGLGLICGGLAAWLMEELALRDYERWIAAADASVSSAP